MAAASKKLFQAARSLLLSASHRSSAAAVLAAEGRTAALATLTNFGRKALPTAYSSYHKQGSHHAASGWGAMAAAVPAAVYMLQDQEAHAAELERTFIAIKPDGVQRGLISEIVNRFERKGYKLVAIKLIVPSKEFAEKHYHISRKGLSSMGCVTFSALALYLQWFGKERVSSSMGEN